MRKFIYFYVLAINFFSCQEDVQFNNPAIQAQKQGVLWRASEFKVSLTSNGEVVILGSKGLESVTLKTTTITPHTSIFGVDASNFGEYNNNVVGFKGNYSTGFNGGSGQLIISNYENNTITGSFKFKAINTNTMLENPDSVNFTEGVFYKIPITKIK